MAIYIGCIGTQAHGLQVTSLLCLSAVIMCNCILAYSGTSGSLFYNNKKHWRARKIIYYLCEGRIEKSVSQDHCLSSQGLFV